MLKTADSFKEDISGQCVNSLNLMWPHTMSCLILHGARTVGQLMALSETELVQVPGISEAALENIKAALKPFGLSLKPPRTDDPEPSSFADKQAIAELPYMDQYVARLLRDAGIVTVGQLLGMTVKDLAGIKGIGAARAGYIGKALAACGWQLKQDPEPKPVRRFEYLSMSGEWKQGSILDTDENGMLICHLDCQPEGRTWPISPAAFGKAYFLIDDVRRVPSRA